MCGSDNMEVEKILQQEVDESDDSDSSQLTNTSSTSNTAINKTKRKKRNEYNSKPKRKGKRMSKNVNAQSTTGNKSKMNYKCTNFIKEDHKQPIFGVQFYQHLIDGEEDPLIFGTVGSNRASIYRCGEDCGRINLYQSYADADPEESFYTCTWTCFPDTGDPVFCFAGAKGIIHVLNPVTRQFVVTFQGHGSAINELKTHPLDSFLILSTSKDHTLRLWNIKTDSCVAAFGGVDGHRDEVLGIDFDILGTRIVSCGMDHSLKFWSLETKEIKKTIADSHNYSAEEEKKVFPTLAVHYPEFTTRDVHRNYVDCCVWLGDLVLSKSCDNQVVCWQAKDSIETIMNRKHNSDIGVFILHKFDITQCDIWFMRFAVDYQQTILALGNQVGKIYLYDLEYEHPSLSKPVLLHHNRCNSAVRQISFSSNAKILIAVCDDGTIWRWDKQV